MTDEEIKKLAAAIGQNMQLYHKEILNTDEAARYLGIEKSYLYKLTSARAIPHYKPTGKLCYFKRTELDEWLTATEVATDLELNTKALAYINRTKY